MNDFEKLYTINVNEKVEKKEGLSYLTWSFAWAELKKIYPDATYTIKKFGDKQLPYVFDENTGYMVFTDVTINGITYEMWLPVMDSKNKAMKNVSYDYTTKYGTKTVDAATMFDVNKTIMRCLVKNLAMFGLGLYIYAGEDLPEGEKEQDPIDSIITESMATNLYAVMQKKGLTDEKIIETLEKGYNVNTVNQLKNSQYAEILRKLNKEEKQ